MELLCHGFRSRQSHAHYARTYSAACIDFWRAWTMQTHTETDRQQQTQNSYRLLLSIKPRGAFIREERLLLIHAYPLIAKENTESFHGNILVKTPASTRFSREYALRHKPLQHDPEHHESQLHRHRLQHDHQSEPDR